MKPKKALTPVRPIPEYLPLEQDGYGLASEGKTHEVNLREYWKVLFKYRALVIACTGICCLLAFVFAFTATPYYTASSKIRINTYEPVLAATKIEDVLQEKSKERNYLETQIQEIESHSLADRVLENNAIREGLFADEGGGLLSALFGSSGDDQDQEALLDDISGYKHSIQEIRGYLGVIDVQPVRRTSLVMIFATAESPRLSALIANEHAKQYIDWVREKWVEQQSHSLKFLTKQATELREKVADLEREMAEYAEDNSIIAVNKDENITAQKMAQLNRLLTDVIAKRIEAENLYKEARESLKSVSAGFDDDSTQRMRSELATLEAELGQLSAKFTGNYPQVKQLKSQIAMLKRSIQEQRRQIVEGLESKAEAIRLEEKRLLEELEEQKSKTFELAKREVHYNVLSRDLLSSRELLQTVLRQIKETALAVEGKSSNVSIVDNAIVPTSASFPRKKLMLLVGLCGGLIVGCGLAFLLNYLDNTLRTPEELTHLLELPNLGVVPSFEVENITKPQIGYDPHTADPGRERGSRDVISASDMPHQSVMFLREPKSLASEAYRTIRTGILLSQAGEPPRTILVSSAQSSEGKTTSTLNLAASLASAGGRVALMDADLRRPSLYKYFGVPPETPGIVEVITGQATPQDVQVTDVVKRISFFPAGKLPPNPAELLGSLEMAAFIDSLASQFDYVLIDSPPLLPVTDAVILSRYVDGVVMVVKGASTPKKVVQDAKHRLDVVGARFLGTVLNDVDVTGGDYYYYNRYYASYYQEEGTERSPRVAS